MQEYLSYLFASLCSLECRQINNIVFTRLRIRWMGNTVIQRWCPLDTWKWPSCGREKRMHFRVNHLLLAVLRAEKNAEPVATDECGLFRELTAARFSSILKTIINRIERWKRKQ